MILLVGCDGNMGKRYAAILRQLGVQYEGVDVAESWPEWQVRQVIIATPTDTHYEMICKAGELYPVADILCEKPLSIYDHEVELLEKYRDRLYVVNQYQYLLPICAPSGDDTYYNYFKHGGDGLAYDCFQLFGVARGAVTLLEDSPVWLCKINGAQVSLADMDYAYVAMVQDFLGPMDHCWNYDKALETTKKVEQWISENNPKRG
jgi:hypothetical protein